MIDGFLHFARRRQGYDAARALQVATLGSRGEAKAVKDTMKEFTGD